MPYFLVLSTAPSLREARRLADLILDHHFAACVNITAAAESHYEWRGKKEKAREYLLLIKTRKALFPVLEKFLRSKHPYETPEIIGIPISQGSKAYLRWIDHETKRP